MAKKFMIFSLGEQRYAISLHVVREVIGLPKITPMPGMPPEYKGLINLRGRIIPTLDLTLRLHPAGPDGARAKRPTIIIADRDGQQVGLMVDEVVEVIPVEESQIDPNVDGIQESDSRAVVGVAKCHEKELTLVLGLERLIGKNEIQERFSHKADSSAA